MDKRSIRTRKWLHEALLNLLKEKTFDAITIQDITDEADIARMTFYRHFQGKEELLQSCIQEFLEGLKSSFKSPLQASKAETGNIARHNLKNFLNYALEHQNQFKILLGSSAGTEVRQQLGNFASKLIYEALEAGGNLRTLTIPPSLIATFVSEGAIGLIINWLETGAKESPEMLAENTMSLIENGVLGLS